MLTKKLEKKLTEDIKSAMTLGVPLEDIFMIMKKLSFLYARLYHDQIQQHLKKARNEDNRTSNKAFSIR